MPLYEYKCKQCRERLEKIQTFSAPPEKVCPKCGGQLERLISAPAFQFKGAGWYVNDYAKSSGTSKATDGSGDKSDGKAEGVSGAASESKASPTPPTESPSSVSSPSSASPSGGATSGSSTKSE